MMKLTMSKEAQTMEGCNERYIPVVKSVEATNTWVRIVSWITIVAFWFCVTVIRDINSNIESIKVSLQFHEKETLTEIYTLKEDMYALKNNRWLKEY